MMMSLHAFKYVNDIIQTMFKHVTVNSNDYCNLDSWVTPCGRIPNTPLQDCYHREMFDIDLCYWLHLELLLPTSIAFQHPLAMCSLVHHP